MNHPGTKTAMSDDVADALTASAAQLESAARRIEHYRLRTEAAEHTVDMQRRNMMAFMRERDEARAILRGLKWAVCESEVLRDQKLPQRARELLNEIADIVVPDAT